MPRGTSSCSPSGGGEAVEPREDPALLDTRRCNGTAGTVWGPHETDPVGFPAHAEKTGPPWATGDGGPGAYFCSLTHKGWSTASTISPTERSPSLRVTSGCGVGGVAQG
jgi:hypothetical protein